MGYLWKVVGLWGLLLVVSSILAALTEWNQTIVGLTIGIAAGFLPSFLLAVLTNMRDWNLENVEKIYAPLMSEIEGLFVYFSGSKQFDANTLFDYGEPTDSQLSSSTWDQLSKDNLLYRLRLDDKVLYNKLLSLYLVLSFYLKNRMEFLHSTLYPAFRRVCNMSEPDISTDIILPKIRTAVRNLVLDALEPTGRTITLGFYAGHTTLFSDYEEVRIRANIPEVSFDAFLLRIGKEIKGDNYDLLIKQRGTLFQQVTIIQSRLAEKLKQVMPT